VAIYKNPKVDIKRKYRRYLEEGLILSLIIVILGFLYFPKFDEKELTTTDMQELVDVEDVVVTQQESAPPPPPKPTIPIEVPQDEVLEDIEYNTILAILDKHHWNTLKTAQELQIHRSTLWRKMKKYGLLQK